MDAISKDLIIALGLGPREHVAVVGGGGKTSLCFAIAEVAVTTGLRVVNTTTTKVWYKEAQRPPCMVFFPPGSTDYSEIKTGLGRYRHIFVAQRILDSGKVKGIDPVVADILFLGLNVDYMVVEADGAAGHAIKAHAQHEPQIPSSATVVIVVIGLDAMGQPLGPETVFRPELFGDICGLNRGERLSPTALAKAFHASDGLFKGTPAPSRRVVFLNRLDLLSRDQEAKELAELLVSGPGSRIDRVLIGSLRKNSYFSYERKYPCMK